MTTSYQSAFWAYQLSLQQAHDNVESLSRSIANARVDLNPHQVDAALFAFRSPLSKGVILADEVGLGKTIEAGIVLLQKWAERKRRILLILPATLRNQWQQELEDKFFIPSMVMEDKTFRTLKKQGKVQPFNQDKVMMVNGMNNDPHSQAIYKAWKERHAGTEKITGVPTVDMRAALVEEFRERASILVATEAAAEGVNLQFCSLVVNYDLPWNPQRIEQRIGRCHRYGQKCDVVLVNFLNKRNEADQRVYQLLSEKFKLFNGVFGSSDEVLGALESGVDIEKRIAAVYQKCRTPQEIKAAFDSLQTELEQQIDHRMASAQQAIIDNFDEDVTQRLKFHEATTQQSLDQLEYCLYRLTQQELATEAVVARRDAMIARVQEQLKARESITPLFTVQWKLEN